MSVSTKPKNVKPKPKLASRKPKFIPTVAPSISKLSGLSLAQMEQLAKNQENLSDEPPLTYRATFKLSKILKLIAEIVKHPDFKIEDDSTHNVCITFVRDDFDSNSNPLGFLSDDYRNLQIKHQSKNDKKFTQVIPIITGCIADWNNGHFRYMRVLDPDTREKIIPFVRPGGEASGLIPPKPPGFDDEDYG